MRKIVLLLTSLLIVTAVNAETSAPVDSNALTKSIMSNMNKSANNASEKGSFAIVYGGQDISRGTMRTHDSYHNSELMG